MPKTIILTKEDFDNDKEEFFTQYVGKFEIEHSLLSVSKWEQKYHKPFQTTNKTKEETMDYIIMMIIGPEDFDISNLQYLSESNVEEINQYINDPMTATTFPEDAINKIVGEPKPTKKEIITNEVVYYMMSAANIPFEVCEKWHFNRLLTLLRVYDNKNKPEKKMSKAEILRRNKALNDARRKKLHTKG